MTMPGLLLVLALTNVDVDIVNLPLTSDARITLAPAGRAELKREGTVTRIKIDIDRLAVPSGFGPAFNTYVVWAVSPEGIYDNIGEMDRNGTKGIFSATSRFGQLGILVTAEPHYMVDRPSSVVVYRSQIPKEDIRRKTATIAVGAYDYSKVTAAPAVSSVAAVHGSVVQARTAFQIAQAAGAERIAPLEFRNARVALGSLEELVSRAAPLDIVWPIANEAIRWSHLAATVAREKR